MTSEDAAAPTVENLLAREAIRDLVARYNYFGDRGRFDEFGDLFTADAVLEFTNADGVRREARGRVQIVDLVRSVGADFMAESRTAGWPPYIRHSVSTHIIDLTDADTATGRAYVTVIRAFGLAEWGTYRDRYSRVRDHWRIDRRAATTDGLLAVPTKR
jgi:ketosteroid isomerase-like protein